MRETALAVVPPHGAPLAPWEVSSANLTAYAFTLNMELGLLVRGGAIPGRVSAHLDRIIDQHILVALHGAD